MGEMGMIKPETIKKLKEIEEEIKCNCGLASLQRPLDIKITCRACGHLLYINEEKKSKQLDFKIIGENDDNDCPNCGLPESGCVCGGSEIIDLETHRNDEASGGNI